MPAPQGVVLPQLAAVLSWQGGHPAIPGTDWAAEAERARAWLLDLPWAWDALTAAERESLLAVADDDLADIEEAGALLNEHTGAYRDCLKVREAVALVAQALVQADDEEGRALRRELAGAAPERQAAIRTRLAWLEHSERPGSGEVPAWGAA